LLGRAVTADDRGAGPAGPRAHRRSSWKLGAEAFRGDHFPRPAAPTKKPLRNPDRPSSHTGGDFNDSSSWLAAPLLHPPPRAHEAHPPRAWPGPEHLQRLRRPRHGPRWSYKWAAPAAIPVNQKPGALRRVFLRPARRGDLRHRRRLPRDPRAAGTSRAVYQVSPRTGAPALRYAHARPAGCPGPRCAARPSTRSAKSPSAGLRPARVRTPASFGPLPRRIHPTTPATHAAPTTKLMFQYTVCLWPARARTGTRRPTDPCVETLLAAGPAPPSLGAGALPPRPAAAPAGVRLRGPSGPALSNEIGGDKVSVYARHHRPCRDPPPDPRRVPA